ncbi:MAG: T9SS type A sorting domain-containing protein, partial [Fibrobacter sp.]|nr:T9SS type A sorting domain-containing protein [Fibrobacter sp.]
RYSNGARKIEWGTSTSYGNSIPLTGTTGTATMSNLEPNTKYYWRVNRSYLGEDALTPASSFTTTSTSAVIDKIAPANLLKFSVGNTPLAIPFNNQKNLAVSVYSTNGRFLLKEQLQVNGMVLKNISLEKYAPGTYLCSIKSDNGKISEFTILNR